MGRLKGYYRDWRGALSPARVALQPIAYIVEEDGDYTLGIEEDATALGLTLEGVTDLTNDRGQWRSLIPTHSSPSG